MKHINGYIEGKHNISTVLLTHDEAKIFINGLFDRRSFIPTFISNENKMRCYEYIIHNIDKASENNDVLISSGGVYPIPFECADLIRTPFDKKIQLNGKDYCCYMYRYDSDDIKYVFKGETTNKFNKTHNVSLQYKPRVTVNFVPVNVEAYFDELSNEEKTRVVYKCVFHRNTYDLEINVDDAILYKRKGEGEENFQTEIEDKIKNYIEKTTLEMFECSVSTIDSIKTIKLEY